MPVAGGVLLFLAMIAFPAPHLVWVALVPWFLHLRRIPDDDLAAHRRSGALLFGVFWALNLHWVLVLIPRIGELWPLWAYLGQLLLLTLLGAALGAGVWALRRAPGLPLPLAGALSWTAVEFARGHLLGPLRFPWTPLALPLAETPALLQPGAWVGESGLGFGIAWVNGLLAASLPTAPGLRSGGVGEGTGPTPRPGVGSGWVRAAAALTALAVLGVWGTAGTARLNAGQEVPVLRAAAVQPALSLAEKRSDEGGLRRAGHVTDSLLATLEPGDAWVVVLPETHLPTRFSSALVMGAGPGRSITGPPSTPTAGDAGSARAPELLAWLAAWSRQLEAELLLGGFVGEGDRTWNAVLQVEGGGAGDWVGKTALVPGVEWPGSLVRGELLPLSVAGTSAGPLICIESAWSPLARRAVRDGAQWLVNVTNDAWLAEAPGWTRTPAFAQHRRHLALRSVETGVGALRVANNGETGYTDGRGLWFPLLPPHEPGVAVAEVTRLDRPTLYLRTGNLWGPMALLMVSIGAVRARVGAGAFRRIGHPR